MKLNPQLTPWTGALISEAVSGIFHGSFVGGGLGVGEGNSDWRVLAKTAVAGAVINAAKEVALYVNKYPMPNLFAAAEPSAALQPDNTTDNEKTK